MAAAGFRAVLIALACASCTSVTADARTFTGTRWHVTAMNGRPTPATGDYHVEFTSSILGGRFGCNAFGGPYAVKDEVMTAGQIESTLMGCSDPAGRFEREGFAILRQAMRIAWQGESRLTLSNASGSIALERAP